jgi:hypothetical protein
MPDDQDEGIRFGTIPKWAVEPPARPLTPEEKAHPLTFFGVTAEMREERAKAAGIRPPSQSRAEHWAERAKARAAEHQPMKYFAKSRDEEQERDRD